MTRTDNRLFLIATVSLSLMLASCGDANNAEMQNNGFTNKAEAKNQMKDGQKEGKWLEYGDVNGGITTDANAPYYTLTIYKAGKPTGAVHNYYKSGKIHIESQFKDSKIDGIYKVYYESGQVFIIIPFTDGKPNGIVNAYYESGKIKGVTNYVNGQVISTKNYDENGNEVK